MPAPRRQRPYTAPARNGGFDIAVRAYGNHGSVRTQSRKDTVRNHDIAQGVPVGKQGAGFRRIRVSAGAAEGDIQRRMRAAKADASVLRHTQRQRIRAAQQADVLPVGGTPDLRPRRTGVQHVPVRPKPQRMRPECLHAGNIFPCTGVTATVRVVSVSQNATVPAQCQHVRCTAGQRHDVPPRAGRLQSPGDEDVPVRRDTAGQPGAAGKPPAVPERLRQPEQVGLPGTQNLCPVCPAVGGEVLKLREQRRPAGQVAPARIHPVTHTPGQTAPARAHLRHGHAPLPVQRQKVRRPDGKRNIPAARRRVCAPAGAYLPLGSQRTDTAA